MLLVPVSPRGRAPSIGPPTALSGGHSSPMPLRALAAAGPLPRGRSEARGGTVGDADCGAGLPWPAPGSLAAPGTERLPDMESSQEALRARIRSLEASGDEHEKLRDRIRSLEDSLQRLGRESLERAKLGMEKLAEKYFPKVRQYESLGLVTAPGELVQPLRAASPVCRSLPTQ